MGALAATDINVALAQQDRGAINGIVKRLAFAAMSFGDGVKTYSTGGIPLPGIGAFGMNKAIEHVFIENPGNGYTYAFDKANQKLKILLAPDTGGGALVEAAATLAPAATVLNLMIIGN